MLVRSLINPERNARNFLRSCCIFGAGASGVNANAFPISARTLASKASVLHARLVLEQISALVKGSLSPMANTRPKRVQARCDKRL
mgnify:CR=1 FL=1